MDNTIAKTSLVLLALKCFRKVGSRSIETGNRGKGEEQEIVSATGKSAQGSDDRDIAAIAMALYLHFNDQHEIEETGFWLNRPLNYQTTWTAKSNLFRKSPIRKY